MTLADPKRQQLVATVTGAAARLDWAVIWDCIDRQGFGVDTRIGPNRRTLAHYAAANGQMQALAALRQRGAQLEGIYDKDGNEPLHLAAKTGRYEVVQWLAKQGVNLASSGHAERRPGPKYMPGGAMRFEELPVPALHWAARRGDAQLAALLLDHGVHADNRDSEGNTPLMALARQPHAQESRQTAALLVLRGADMHALNTKGESVMMAATYRPNTFGLADFMADMGAPLDHPDAACSLREWMSKRPLNAEQAQRFVQGRQGIAQIDPQAITSKHALFARNPQGYAPLDDPRNWQRLPEIAAALHTRGEPLTKSDFCADGQEGMHWLARAVECGGYDALQQVLRAAGDPIRGHDFADAADAQSPNAAGMAAKDMWLGLHVLGDPEHWRGRGLPEARQFMRELPAALREQVNLHQLYAALQQEAQQPALGR